MLPREQRMECFALQPRTPSCHAGHEFKCGWRAKLQKKGMSAAVYVLSPAVQTIFPSADSGRRRVGSLLQSSVTPRCA
jgi:hypothetical protein